MLYFNRKTYYKAQHENLTGWYDSQGEATLARALDICWTDGYVKNVERQVRFPLFKDGERVCFHKPDFIITFQNGKQEVREFKGNYEGWLLKRWTDKLKLWPENYPNIPYLTVKEGYHRKHTLYTLEEILGQIPTLKPKTYVPQAKPSKSRFYLAKTVHHIGQRIMG